MSYNVETKEIESGIFVAYLDHKGPYLDISSTFEKLMQLADKQNLINGNSRRLGIYYDNPETVKAEDLQSKACITIDKDTEVKEGLKKQELPSGKYVSVLFKEPYEKLYDLYTYVYGAWAIENNVQLTFPTVEEYLNNPQNTPAEELLTNSYIPIA